MNSKKLKINIMFFLKYISEIYCALYFWAQYNNIYAIFNGIIITLEQHTKF